MTNIYHQMGHNWKWNVDSLQTDSCGDGLIIGPRYTERHKVESLPKELKRRSIFDPQFFLPATARGKLSTYDFFPQVMSQNFSTLEYNETFAEKSAETCLLFQKNNEYEKCIIPCRLILNSDSEDFIEEQSKLFVSPFLKQATNLQIKQPILLQIILTERILRDAKFTSALLNWITSLDLISGCYIIPYLPSREKQIKDPDYLISLMQFIHDLRSNNMEVIVGYLNTEAIVLLAANPTGIATGAYENLRAFNPQAFTDDDRQKRGPVARIFVVRLLQWIDNRYLRPVEQSLKWSRPTLDDSRYTPLWATPDFNWHFSKPEIYKHYFSVFMPLLQTLGKMPPDAIIPEIKDRIETARGYFDKIEKAGVVLAHNDDGSHLPFWLTALNLFTKNL
jgi:hypothetical protein